MKNNINLIKCSVKESWQKIEEVKDYVEVIVDYLRINTRWIKIMYINNILVNYNNL